jgi:hypothetical protein
VLSFVRAEPSEVLLTAVLALRFDWAGLWRMSSAASETGPSQMVLVDAHDSVERPVLLVNGCDGGRRASETVVTGEVATIPRTARGHVEVGEILHCTGVGSPRNVDYRNVAGSAH